MQQHRFLTVAAQLYCTEPRPLGSGALITRDFFMFRFVIVLLLITIAGCSYNPLSSTNHNTGSPVAATAGGAIGVGTAAAFGVSYKPLLGAAGLTGAGVGYYLSTLRYDASGIYHAGGQVFTLGDYLTIEIPTHRIFDDNSADLLPEGEAAMRSTVKVLNRLCCQSILVSGNSSGFATERLERKLTTQRARVVAAYLWAHGINNFQQSSINMRKLTYVGYGNYFPIANNITNKGIRANSRIQITAYPNKDQLLITEKQKTFDNMGESYPPDEPHLATLDDDKAFASNDFDVLPDYAAHGSADMQG